MSIDKLREAGELIKARKFPQARAILVGLDHPKAREWLAKIDAMNIEDPFENMAPAEPVRRRRLPLPVVLLLLVILIAVGAYAALNIADQRRNNDIVFGTAMQSHYQTQTAAPK